MGQNQFVNRKKDIEKLVNFIKTDCTENKINIVFAKSGVGKTAFTKKVLHEQSYRFPINIELKDGQHPEGKTIELLAEQFDISARENPSLITFSSFIDNAKSKGLKKRIGNIFRNSFNSTIPLVEFANKSLDYLLKTGQFDYKLLFNSSITELLLIHKDYIEYNIRRSRVVTNIQNAQSIDKTSLNLIRDINEQKISAMFIMEYTTNGKSIQIEREALANFLNSPSTIVEQFDLAKLSFDDYLRIITSKGIDKPTLETILRYTYVKFDGDLRNLTDTDIILSVNNDTLPIIQAINDGTFYPQQKNIDNLNKDELFVLCSIVAHESNLSLRSLLSFAKRKEIRDLPIDLDLTLEKLEAHKLIYRHGGSVSISHDSIASTIKQDYQYFRYTFLAHKVWAEYYSEIINSNNYIHISKEAALFQLFRSLLIYSPSALTGVISEIRSILVNVIRPDIAVDYLESLKNVVLEFQSDQREALLFSFLEIYYHLGVYDKAQDILTLIKQESLEKILYQSIIYNRLDHFETAINFINKHLENNSNPRFVFCMKLIQMITYRSMSNFDKCQEIYADLANRKENEAILEYGYFLRNSEIVLPIEESIKKSIDSILFFQKHNLNIQVGHSKITLGMLYAWNGELDKGLEELEEAQQILFGATLERHLIYNDRAAIMLYQGRFDDEVENCLNEAKSTALTSFDKIAIYVNMLILYKYQEKHDRCDIIISMIIEWLKVERDKIVHRLSYYHLSWYYNNINPPLGNHFMMKAKEINVSLDNEYDLYWNCRLNSLKGSEALNNYQRFLLSYEFEPFFISYWHFEIPKKFN